jgi:hypothetical protein
MLLRNEAAAFSASLFGFYGLKGDGTSAVDLLLRKIP